MKTLIISSLFLLIGFITDITRTPINEIRTCKVYAPYYAFKKIIKKPKYHCYGRPKEPYRTKHCNIPSCGEKYIRQSFCKNGEYTTTFYHSKTQCRYSDTNYHSHLKIGITEPCGCEGDGISIGENY
jgi:hypothetical protein